MLVIAICDDEPIFARQLQLAIQEFAVQNNIDLMIDLFKSPTDLIKRVAEKPNRYSFYFLDIIMNPYNGIDCAKQLRTFAPKAPIIFVTSSPDFAIEGYSVSAKQYILKPINPQQLHTILCRLFIEEEQFITLHLAHSTYKSVNIADILFVESHGRKLVFHFQNGDSDEFYGRLYEYEERLPNHQFFHVHQSYIVNLMHIHRIERMFVYLKTGDQIPISRKKKDELVQSFLQFIRLYEP